MPLPLCQLPSPAGTGVVMTTPSLTACAVTFLVAALIVSAAPFVLPVNITPVEQGRKLCCIKLLRELAKMLAVFEDLWTLGRSTFPCPGPSSALQPPLVTPPVPPPAVPAPVPPAVPVAVLVVLAAASSTRTDSSSHSAASPFTWAFAVPSIALPGTCGVPVSSGLGWPWFLVPFLVPSPVW